jgi:hypothetical protein
MNQPIWEKWAARLYHWQLHEFTASFLEAAGPLTMLGAQLVYLGEPVLTIFTPRKNTRALAHLLENPSSRQNFIDLLRTARPSNRTGGPSP